MIGVKRNKKRQNSRRLVISERVKPEIVELREKDGPCDPTPERLPKFMGDMIVSAWDQETYSKETFWQQLKKEKIRKLLDGNKLLF